MLPRSLCPLALLVVVVVVVVEAQYEKYSFRGFPLKDIMPLDSAYNYALEQYAAQKWGESVKYLELGLRLHRLLRDSESFCGRNCSAAARRDGAGDGDDTLLADSSLRVVRHILRRAACLKKCKAGFPVFNLSYPKRDLLETFEQRIPYRYIQYAYFQVRPEARRAPKTGTQEKCNRPQTNSIKWVLYKCTSIKLLHMEVRLNSFTRDKKYANRVFMWMQRYNDGA
ncbi:hypothetical protein F2P81_015325 [Scophthalmus maximus]|uniref:Leprecan-like alpha-helical domain-containing protein n=1 Tax=Scophthalmus maximus TaxID=52904 RepID=A0A6A4SKH4_SCOMX|nr:hypothetical protein F2P81_015325 [Scophthalmus maximus]